MEIEGWKYYNHAAIPSTPPHNPVNLKPVEDGSIWQIGEHTPHLVRWTSEWDCGHETNWWYCIKDTPFDLTALKSKRRYEIKKGNKNFEVKEIDPTEYADELFIITVAAYATYPVSYRPNITQNEFVKDVQTWDFYKIYGAFFVEENQLCGYAILRKDGNYIDFRNLKVRPDKEKLAINAAIVNKILADHEEFLESGGYICDGARSIQHETAFQDYLEKYFEFRKAYCALHIMYSKKTNFVINVLYPIRGLLKKMGSISLIRKVNALLRMEEINRAFD